jgi:hypothetical protein
MEVTASLVAGDGGSLRVTTRDPTHVVQRLVVGWRWGIQGPFSTSTPVVGDAIEVPVATAPPGAARLDYYAEALDDRGDVVFEAGNEAAPKTALVPVLPPPPPPPVLLPAHAEPRSTRSVFASPVFWAVAGGVILAAGTGAYFGLRGNREETLPPSSTSLGPILLCGANRCQ